MKTQKKTCYKITGERKCRTSGCCYTGVECIECGKEIVSTYFPGKSVLNEIKRKAERGEELSLREEIELQHDRLQDQISFDIDNNQRYKYRKGVPYENFRTKQTKSNPKNILKLGPKEKRKLMLNLLKLMWEGTTVDSEGLSPSKQQILALYEHLHDEFRYNFKIDPKSWVEFIWETDENWLFWKNRWSNEPWKEQKDDLLRRAKIICREVVLSGRDLCTFDGHGRFIYLFYKCLYFCTNLFDTNVDKYGFEVLPQFDVKFTDRNYIKPMIKVYTLGKGSEYIWHEWFLPNTIDNIPTNIFDSIFNRKTGNLNCKMLEQNVIYLNFCGIGDSYLDLTKLISLFKDYISIKNKERVYRNTLLQLCAVENLDVKPDERETYKQIVQAKMFNNCENPIIYVSYMTGSEDWRPMVKSVANNGFRTCVSLPLLEACELVSLREGFYTRKIVGDVPEETESNNTEDSDEYEVIIEEITEQNIKRIIEENPYITLKELISMFHFSSNNSNKKIFMNIVNKIAVTKNVKGNKVLRIRNNSERPYNLRKRK